MDLHTISEEHKPLSVPDVLSKISCSAIWLRRTDVGLCHDEFESCCFHCLSSLFSALQWLNREAEQAIPQKRPRLGRLDFGLLADALPSKPFLLDLTGWTETPLRRQLQRSPGPKPWKDLKWKPASCTVLGNNTVAEVQSCMDNFGVLTTTQAEASVL